MAAYSGNIISDACERFKNKATRIICNTMLKYSKYSIPVLAIASATQKLSSHVHRFKPDLEYVICRLLRSCMFSWTNFVLT